MTSLVELPIDEVLPELKAALDDRHEVVLEAPPGAGKTTRVPLALLDAPWLKRQSILMLEPRRLAARAAAERLANSLGEKVGEQVGYRIRHESKVSSRTRIEVITEGVLTRRLQSDPGLDGVGLVIFDEFHERSLDADLGLALTLYGRTLLRDESDPLKILVMSATLDGEAVAALLGDAPRVTSQGRSYPVQMRYLSDFTKGVTRAPSLDDRIEPLTGRAIVHALEHNEGSLLVFLPGRAEIERTATLVETLAKDTPGLFDNVSLRKLYGDLTLADQRQAIAPAPAGERKIVLATAIAETSLTIEGVRVVIDAGRARGPMFDARTAMTRLRTTRVSRDAASQRAGRAGRLEPGVCYRLWPESAHGSLAAFATPEIVEADLAPLVLQLHAFGVSDPGELAWLDHPPKPARAQAEALLVGLQALATDDDDRLKITAHGESIAALPSHPRIGHLLVKGKALGLGSTAAHVAALLGGRDPLRDGADLTTRVRALVNPRDADNGRVNRGAMHELKASVKQFERALKVKPEAVDFQAVGKLVALAYPDRIAFRRSTSSADYLLHGGRGARLRDDDPLTGSAWLAVAHLGGREGDAVDQIYLACSLDPALFDDELEFLVAYDEVVEWDRQAERLVAQSRACVGSIVLSSSDLDSVSPEKRAGALAGLVQRQGLRLLPFTKEIDAWRARVNFLRAEDVDTPEPWPDVSDQGLLASTSLWLEPWLDGVSHINHFAKLDLAAMLKSLVPWSLQARLDELAPARYEVPSGSRLTIDYADSPPSLAVKLQEMFGCTVQPLVAGRIALKLKLLSPASRPVQVTQDIAGFWAGSYIDVKKEMKGRYPKHQWPDDPISASATARTTKPKRT